LADVPGGVRWDDWRMNDLMNTFGWVTQHDTRCFIEMPSADWKDLILKINTLSRGAWHQISCWPPGEDKLSGQFTAIRQGMPPDDAFRQLFNALYSQN
jgi:hypothetical protein